MMGWATVILTHVASAEVVVETVPGFRNRTFVKAEQVKVPLIRSRV